VAAVFSAVGVTSETWRVVSGKRQCSPSGEGLPREKMVLNDHPVDFGIRKVVLYNIRLGAKWPNDMIK
jgi:hypothetical protein